MLKKLFSSGRPGTGTEGSKGGLDPDSDSDEDAQRNATKSLRPAGPNRTPPRSKVAGIKELPALARRSLQLRRWKRRRLPGQLCGVIRHAERADGIYAFINGQRWTQTDDFRQYPMDPPLSDAGIEGAKEVGQQVADFADSEGVPVHTVITSPYFRCVQTAVEVCIKLGPHIRLIIDQSLGEVYGPSVMGAFEPLCATRPFDTALRYIEYKGVTCVQKAVGKWPAWPEDLKCARKRYANGYLSYLHRSALAKRNFVIVTHADCVGASLSLMPSQAGFAVESVEYGGMLLATRGLGEAKANDTLAEVPDREDLGFEDILPSQAPSRRVSDTGAARSEKHSWFPVPKGRRRHTDAGTGKTRMNAWDEGQEEEGSGSDGRNASPERLSSPCAQKAIQMPQAADGWKVRIHNVNTRSIPKEKASKSTKAMKSIKSLVRNTAYTQEQIETLLGMMSDKPLEGGEELQTSQRSMKAPDSRILSKTDCSLATYIFGMSECGSNMDECRSQCSESEFMYMAMHGVPCSREGTLDQIDESHMEPGSPMVTDFKNQERYQAHELRRIIENSSRRTGRDHKRHLSPPCRTAESLELGEDASPQGAPRSVTLEEVRNLNENQMRELISASTTERREKLANGIPRTLGIVAAEKKLGLKGKKVPFHRDADSLSNSSQSPPGSYDVASFSSQSSRKDMNMHMRIVQRRSLNTIPSDTEMCPRSDSPCYSEDSLSSGPKSNGSGGGFMPLPFPDKPRSHGRLGNWMQQAKVAETGSLKSEDKTMDEARRSATTTAAASDSASGGSDSSRSEKSSASLPQTTQNFAKASATRPPPIQVAKGPAPQLSLSAVPPVAEASADSSEPDASQRRPSKHKAGRPMAIQVVKPEVPNLTLTCMSNAQPEPDRGSQPSTPPERRLSEAYGSEGAQSEGQRRLSKHKAPPNLTLTALASEEPGRGRSPPNRRVSEAKALPEERTAAESPLGGSFDTARRKRDMARPLRIEVASDPAKPALQLTSIPKAEEQGAELVPPKAEEGGTASSSAGTGAAPTAFAPSFEGSALMKRRAMKAATAAGTPQAGPAAGLRLEPLSPKDSSIPSAGADANGSS